MWNFLSVDRYYKMKTDELEREAGKWHIGGYFDGRWIDRERIITQLLEKDKANNSRLAILVSIIALVVSIVALFI